MGNANVFNSDSRVFKHNINATGNGSPKLKIASGTVRPLLHHKDVVKRIILVGEDVQITPHVQMCVSIVRQSVLQWVKHPESSFNKLLLNPAKILFDLFRIQFAYRS